MVGHAKSPRYATYCVFIERKFGNHPLPPKENGAFLMTLNLDVLGGVGGPTYEKYKDFLVDEMKACPNGVAKKW